MTLISGDDSLQEHQLDPLRLKQCHRHRPTVCALSDLDHGKSRIEQACPGGIVSSQRRPPQAGSKVVKRETVVLFSLFPIEACSDEPFRCIVVA